MRPNYEARLERLRELVARDGFDGLLISDPANIRYLTGFSGTWSRVVLGPLAIVLVVDRRYLAYTADLPAGVEVVCVEGVRHADAMREATIMAGGVRLSFEPGALSWWEQGAIEMRLPVHATFLPAGGQVEELRLLKDETELALVAQAARATDIAIAEVLEFARPGLRELDLAADLAAALRRHGDGGAPAFEPLVSSGPETARIHGRPGARRLAVGDLLLVDAGATFGGMCADCCRTLVIGGRPDRRQAEALAVVGEALELARDAVRPGRPAREVALAAKRALTRHGFTLDHDVGHGVGLEVHEEPRIAPDSNTELAPGMVIALEPGLYVPGWGGVRLEDLIAVTPQGARVLTAAPRITVSGA